MKPLPGTLDMLDGLQAAHRAFAEQEALLLERIRQLQAEVAEIGRSHAEQAGRIADLESVLATRSALEQAESERIQNQAAEVEARLADAMKREKDLLGELRTALAALLTQREDRARASALEIELQAREESLTESNAENLRLRAEAEASQRVAQRSAFEAERRLATVQVRVQELEDRISTLRTRHEAQVQLYLDEISRANARVPQASNDARARFVHVESSPLVDALFRLDISAIKAAEVIMDAPLFTRTNFQPAFTVRKSGEYDLDDFLVLHDRTFVRAAYLAILRRPADPDGEAFYLAQVRAGEYKSRILDQILHSEEAKAHATKIRGLREHLGMLRLCRVPIFGRWIAAVLFLARVDEHLRELRGFENHVIRMAEEAQLIHEANINKLRSIT